MSCNILTSNLFDPTISKPSCVEKQRLFEYYYHYVCICSQSPTTTISTVLCPVHVCLCINNCAIFYSFRPFHFLTVIIIIFPSGIGYSLIINKSCVCCACRFESFRVYFIHCIVRYHFIATTCQQVSHNNEIRIVIVILVPPKYIAYFSFFLVVFGILL